MNFEILTDLIWEVAKNNPKGFTHSLSKEIPTTGYVVAYKATQNSFGMEGLKACVTHAIYHDGLIGGWLDDDSEQYYFDSVTIISELKFALEFGKLQEQKAIWDIEGQCEIRL